MFAAETGSGKTLAYLLPIVQSLLSEKAKENKELPAATFPKTIVLTPTQELTEQVVVRKTRQLHRLKCCLTYRATTYLLPNVFTLNVFVFEYNFLASLFEVVLDYC